MGVFPWYSVFKKTDASEGLDSMEILPLVIAGVIVGVIGIRTALAVLVVLSKTVTLLE